MKFMIMHKMTAGLETGTPNNAVIENVGRFIGSAGKAFLGGEGLKPTKQRIRLDYKAGKRTLARGPFPDHGQLPAGFGLVVARTEEEAIAVCDRYAKAVGNTALYLGPVVEPWDLGFAPKPADAPLRFLVLPEGDEPCDAKALASAGAVSSGALASSKHGARIRFEHGKHRVIDGPFAESKELIAGYAIMDLPSKEAAVEWGVRFGAVVEVNEVDVRELA